MSFPWTKFKLWKLLALAALPILTIGLWLAIPAYFQSLDPLLLTPRERDATARRLLAGGGLTFAGFILAFLARLFVSIERGPR